MTTAESTTTRRPGTVSYAASVAASEGAVEVTITRDIVAGICGPFGGFTLESGATMRDVSAELERQGYAPVAIDDWQARVCFDGIRLEAALTR